MPAENPFTSVEPLLSVVDLHVSTRDRFGKRRNLVRGIDFELFDGETAALLGETGSGKTVFAESLTRLVRGARYRGRVHLRGHPGSLLRRGEWRLSRIRGGLISYIFGGLRDSLHAHVPVRDQMKEVLNRHRPEVRDEREETAFWMSKVGVAEPEVVMDSFAWQLDPVLQTRVNVAIALCTYPLVLVADEPAAGLDQSNEEQILSLIGELTRSAGVATLLATRDVRVLRRLADRVAVFEGGRVVESGNLAEVMGAPKHQLTRRMLECAVGGRA